MDCSYGYYGSAGCNGSNAVIYYDWIVNQNDGRLQMEFCNPYQGENRRCVDNDRCNYMGAHLIGLLKN